MNHVVTYRFSKATYERQRNCIVLQLRKDGFSANREYDGENNLELLKTNATSHQVRLAAKVGYVIHD